jgi:hypothetical protein
LGGLVDSSREAAMSIGGWIRKLLSVGEQESRKDAADVDISIHFERQEPEPDPPWLVRINQRPPRGFGRKLVEFVKVAGVTRAGRSRVVNEFLLGDEQRITLRPEPSNPVDPNAIAVVGHWTVEGIQKDAQLGYLPREAAQKCIDLLRQGKMEPTIAVLYLPHENYSPGIRLDLWTHRRRPKEVPEAPYDSSIKVPSDPVERNLEGRELEKQGLVDNAIEFYQANVADGFDGNFPYDRLAVLFRKRKQFDREVLVLERAIEVFESLRASTRRGDVSPKLESFRARVKKAKSLAESEA